MKQIKKHYCEILQIELEDLKEDLDCMIQHAEQHFQSGKITERVYKENSTLFKNEKLGVDEFAAILKRQNLDAFADLSALIDSLKIAFRETAGRLALANAVVICVERKLEKVQRYVMQTR